MTVFNSISSLQEQLKKDYNKTIGFVATMGALHYGHVKLINQAREENEIVIVSIFINPTQFLTHEDFDKYPKEEKADKKICQVANVDYLFMPQKEDLFKEDEIKIVAPSVRGYILEGASRPGHFDGVLTVVMKLLNIIHPTNAYFGKKDAQQLYLILLMIKQMFMDINIIAVDTIRDIDGLAQSSRNRYLSKEQKIQALKIPTALRNATNLISLHVKDCKKIIKTMEKTLEPLEIVYIAIVNREFKALKEIEYLNTIILVEVLVGGVRLLDNIWF